MYAPVFHMRRPLDVLRNPFGEIAQTVTEPSVHRVLEVRVRVDEARQDHRVVVVTLGAALGDLDDRSALVTHDAVPDRRPVEREHPLGRDLAHVPAVATARPARRSSSTEAQIDAS